MTDEYLSCDIIEYGFDVQINSIDLCCRISGDTDDKTYHILYPYQGEKIDWDDFFSKKQKIRDIHRKGEIFKPCSGCLYLKTESWEKENIIKTVNINNWVKCNANCIYCDRPAQKNKKEYQILPVFKDMVEKNILKNGGPITISGGEPTIIREFEPLLKLFIKKNLKFIKVLTNGIKYSKAIEEGLKKGVVNILISPDSGTREIYKKVKGVDKYNDVWKNIKKYVSKAKNPELVKTKYILIPGINTSFGELSEFIKQNSIAGVKHSEIDVEIGWFYRARAGKNNFDKIYKLYEYSVQQAEKLGIYLEPKDRMVLLLQDIGAM